MFYSWMLDNPLAPDPPSIGWDSLFSPLKTFWSLGLKNKNSFTYMMVLQKNDEKVESQDICTRFGVKMFKSRHKLFTRRTFHEDPLCSLFPHSLVSSSFWVTPMVRVSHSVLVWRICYIFCTLKPWSCWEPELINSDFPLQIFNHYCSFNT